LTTLTQTDMLFPSEYCEKHQSSAEYPEFINNKHVILKTPCKPAKQCYTYTRNIIRLWPI